MRWRGGNTLLHLCEKGAAHIDNGDLIKVNVTLHPINIQLIQ